MFLLKKDASLPTIINHRHRLEPDRGSAIELLSNGLALIIGPKFGPMDFYQGYETRSIEALEQ